MRLWVLIISMLMMSTGVFADCANPASKDENTKLGNKITTDNADSAVESKNTVEQGETNKNVPKDKINVPHALLRGTVNLGTFWLEIPREIVVESNYNPFFGIVVGTVKGTYHGCLRIIYGTCDILLLGFTGPSGYNAELPEYVWNAQWNPWPKKAQRIILER